MGPTSPEFASSGLRSFSGATNRPARPSADVGIPPESRELVEGALAIARAHLGMDIAWLAEFLGDKKVFRAVEGDKEGWSLSEGDTMSGADSYCQRMLDGRLPNLIPDARENDVVKNLDVTRRLRIAGYVGVPLVLSDGRVFGAFCCASRSAAYSLGQHHVEFVRVLSRLVARELELLESERERRRLEGEEVALDALLAALEARDGYSAGHARAVADLAVRVAWRLGLPDAQVAEVEQVALLHDIGKVAVPDRILQKADALDPEERALMDDHPRIGGEIVGSIRSLAHLAPLVRAEHERWDGTGYPDALVGDEIPVASRITFACDSVHAMLSDRPYRKALDLVSALAELRRNAGGQFWPDAADALIAEIGESETGLLRSVTNTARNLGG